ncbi:MAG: MerR family transcriptional regulator, partial [Clostridium sp.]
MKSQLKMVNEISKLTGITVRALHYYDEINLLKPSDNSESGYRLYSDEDIESLHQIMFLKEIGFELKQIKGIINNPEFDKRSALEKHKEILILKKKRIENLIQLVDSKLEGDSNLSFSEFDELSIIAKQKEYYEEVLKRWKNTQEHKEFEEKQYKSNNQFIDIDKKVRGIFGEVAECMELPPSCKKVQSLISLWQKYITENYYNCTNEMLQCLALMYVEDERFKFYINSIGDNLAEYISKAINFYCNSKEEK